jgi:hypothetical protein
MNMDNFEEKLKELPLRAPSSELDQRVLNQKPPRILPVANHRGRAFWLSAAAAAIFFVGFLLGAKTQGPDNTETTLAQAPTPNIDITATTPSVAVDNEQEFNIPPDQAEQEDVDVAELETRRYRDEQGRLVIETTPGSGGGMTWIIDGSFKLAGSSIDEQME